MKKRMIFPCFVLLLLTLLLVTPTSADMGPKPSLQITVENPPEGVYYLDLLVNRTPNNPSNLLLSNEGEKLAPDIAAALTSKVEEGWFPALTCSENGPPIYGHLTSENRVHRFGYIIPDEFCIAIVDANGKMTVSELVRPGRFHAELTYDFATHRITQPPLLFSYLLQFLSTCIPTLLIEAVILLLFHFSFSKSWKPFLLVNLVTQIGLTITMGAALIQNGLIVAYFIYIPAEFVILLLETIAYLVLLKEFSYVRRIGYTITANVVSAGIGLLLIPISYFLQLSL